MTDSSSSYEAPPDLPGRADEGAQSAAGPVPSDAGDSSPQESNRRFWRPDLYLAALVPVIVALVAIRVDERVASGPSWDTYAFLVNAADLAGRSVGYVEPHRPFMLPFLTSLVFRFSELRVETIQVIDGVLTVLGVLAFYLLMRRRFERPLAAAASVLLLVVPPLWAWLGAGYTDFASVALSIWAMLLLVKATEDDPRWYWAAFPMLTCAVLTRFGALLMVFPGLVWMMLRAEPFKHARQILTGLGLSLVAYVPAGLYYASYYNDPFFPFGFAGKVAESGLASASRSVSSALSWIPGWHYIRNLVNLLVRERSAVPGGALVAASGIGLLFAAVGTLARQRPLWRSGVVVGAGVLVVLAELRGGSLARLLAITLLGFVIGKLIIPSASGGGHAAADLGSWRKQRGLEPRAILALDAAMLVWGLVFFDAHGHMQPQIDRYFITMAPAAVYFVALGLRALGVPLTLLVNAFKSGLSARPNVYSRAGAVLGVVCLVWAAVLVSDSVMQRYSDEEEVKRDPIVVGAEESAKWLLRTDPQVREKTVYSDIWPLMSWYLGSEVKAMPTFESAKAFPHELQKNRVDYFVTIRSHRYPGYKPVHGAASTTVLKAQSTFPRALPAVAYLGDGWDAYLEQLCDFDFNLYFSSRRQKGTGTWMIDSMTPEQLAEYDAVAVFGARWRNKGAAERVLREYVENGGTVIIDASYNMDGFNYPLVDTAFMDMVIRRRRVPPSAEMTVSPELAMTSRVSPVLQPGPFLDERGGPWFGARSTAAPWTSVGDSGSPDHEVIASLDGAPAITLQRLGKGRIYWVGGNLVWHSYYQGTESEVRVVRGLFREALGLPAIPEADVALGTKPWFESRRQRKARRDAARQSQETTVQPGVIEANEGDELAVSPHGHLPE